ARAASSAPMMRHERDARAARLDEADARRRIMHRFLWLLAFALLAAMLLPVPAMAQGTTGAPPAVGIVRAEFKPMAERTEINGRIEARNRVDLIARVTAFLNERLFTEG